MEFTQSSRTHQPQQEAVHIAREIYLQRPHWLTFFREVLGVGGVVRRLFPEDTEYIAFVQSAAYTEIQQMLTDLRQAADAEGDHREATRVITVRLPSSLHEALRAEAFSHQTSMNQLCIAKLLQVIDQQMTSEKKQNSTTKAAENEDRRVDE